MAALRAGVQSSSAASPIPRRPRTRSSSNRTSAPCRPQLHRALPRDPGPPGRRAELRAQFEGARIADLRRGSQVQRTRPATPPAPT
eukprot:15475629-Alexandrium_andersonii.AAC.2